MAATILNSTKQGDKYVSESFEMTLIMQACK